MSEISHYIARYPLFSTLTASDQMRLAELLELKRYPARETIFRFNDPGTMMYFLCEGSVRFVTHDYTGHEVVLEEIQSGDLFGEVALFTGGERAADAVTTGETVLLALHRDQRKEFLGRCPEVAEFCVVRLAGRLSSANRLLRNANTGVDEVVAAERSGADRIVKKIVDIFGTLPSFLLHLLIIGLWILLKWVFHSPWMRFERDELLILSVLLNVEGFAVSMLILVNQARESKEEAVRDRTEFDATINTDHAIRYMHEKMDTLSARIHRMEENQNLTPLPRFARPRIRPQSCMRRKSTARLSSK